MMLAKLFQHPIALSPSVVMWLILPLSFAVAVVYKAIRTQRPSRLWLEILGSMAYIVAGLTGLSVALWLVMRFWP